MSDRVAVGSSRIRVRASATSPRAISSSWRFASGNASTGMSRSRSSRPAEASADCIRSCSFSLRTKRPEVRRMLRAILSRTDSSGITESSWNTMATSDDSEPPGNVTSPVSAVTTPAITLTRVLFPAPFSPSSACTSPARKSTETSLSAFAPPKLLLILLTESRTSVLRTTLTSFRLIGSRTTLSDPTHRCQVKDYMCTYFCKPQAAGQYTTEGSLESAFSCELRLFSTEYAIRARLVAGSVAQQGARIVSTSS